MIDKDGIIKWVYRDLELRENEKIYALYDVGGAKKRGITKSDGLPIDHIFISIRPRTGKGHSEAQMLSLADGKRKYVWQD